MIGSLRSYADTFREIRWFQRNLNIKPTDYVLDVGSGGNPNLRSNVLCDRYLVSGTERHGSPVVVDRPFVAADVNRLPFKDGAFDYVILSHVLEHLPDPEGALTELQRVAKRGYIETPSATYEKVYGYPFHRWMVSTEGETLVLKSKESAVLDPELRTWFERMHAKLGSARGFWARRRDLGVFTSFQWNGRIPLRIEGNSSAPETDFAHSEVLAADVPPSSVRGPSDGGPVWRLQQYVSRRMRSRSDRPATALFDILCCPVCRGDFARTDEQTLRCTRCSGEFPIDQRGIPLLLGEYRRVPGGSTQVR